jgi:hypothetical protein
VSRPQLINTIVVPLLLLSGIFLWLGSRVFVQENA